MAVSAEVRKVENEIDERVRAIPMWRCARELVIRAALDYYRNVALTLMTMIAWTATQEPLSGFAWSKGFHCLRIALEPASSTS